jgi:hypothetical protein
MRKLRFFNYHFPEFLIFICTAQVFALGIGKTQQQSFSVAKYQKKIIVAVCPSVIPRAALDNDSRYRSL